MNEKEVSDWLKSMSDKQFIDFFYKHLSQRHLFPGEEAYLECHLVLVAATREFDNGQWGSRELQLQLLCPAPTEKWVDDAPICQFGEHCEHGTASWAKHSECPVCGGDVYGT